MVLLRRCKDLFLVLGNFRRPYLQKDSRASQCSKHNLMAASGISHVKKFSRSSACTSAATSFSINSPCEIMTILTSGSAVISAMSLLGVVVPKIGVLYPEDCVGRLGIQANFRLSTEGILLRHFPSVLSISTIFGCPVFLRL